MSALIDLMTDLAKDAAAARQRYAADLAQFPVDEKAFDRALEAYNEEYHRVWTIGPPRYRDEESHHDAQASALEKALHIYLVEAGR